MKFFKRLICFLISALFLMNIVAPMRVYAADSKDVNSYISELIAYYRDYQKELNTVRSNINSILGKEYPHQKTHTKEQTLT